MNSQLFNMYNTEQSTYLDVDREADTDLELGLSPRYSTIPASPPSYFSTQLQVHPPMVTILHNQSQNQQHIHEDSLPSYLQPVHIRPSSQSNHFNPTYHEAQVHHSLHGYFGRQEHTSKRETEIDWPRRIQEKKQRAKSRIGGAIRRLMKIMVAILIVVALAIVMLLILLRVRDV